MGLYHRPYFVCQLVPWNGCTTAIGWPAPVMYGQHHCQTWALPLVCAKKKCYSGWTGMGRGESHHGIPCFFGIQNMMLDCFTIVCFTAEYHKPSLASHFMLNHLGVMQISWTQSHWHYHKSTFSRLQTCRLLMWFACTFKFIPVPLWTFFFLIHSHSSA